MEGRQEEDSVVGPLNRLCLQFDSGHVLFAEFDPPDFL